MNASKILCTMTRDFWDGRPPSPVQGLVCILKSASWIQVCTAFSDEAHFISLTMNLKIKLFCVISIARSENDTETCRPTL